MLNIAACLTHGKDRTHENVKIDVLMGPVFSRWFCSSIPRDGTTSQNPSVSALLHERFVCHFNADRSAPLSKASAYCSPHFVLYDIFKSSWSSKQSRLNLRPSGEVHDADHGLAGDLAPSPDHRKSHVLHIIVTKKDALQIVQDDLDGPVGGVPYPGVVAPFGGCNLDLHKGLFKMRQRSLSGRL